MRGFLEIVDVVPRHVFGPPGETRGVAEQLPNLDLLLALSGELRPIAGTPCVEIQLAAIGKDERRHRGHRLGRRMSANNRVAFPFACERAVDVAAPDVHNRLAIDEDRRRRADVVAVLQALRERVTNRPKTERDDPVNLWAGSVEGQVELVPRKDGCG
jgi:hypothetical protein